MPLRAIRDDEPCAISLALTKVGASAANKVTGSLGSHFRGNEGESMNFRNQS